SCQILFDFIQSKRFKSLCLIKKKAVLDKTKHITQMIHPTEKDKKFFFNRCANFLKHKTKKDSQIELESTINTQEARNTHHVAGSKSYKWSRNVPFFLKKFQSNNNYFFLVLVVPSTFFFLPPSPIKDVQISSDGTKIVSASADETIRIWDLASGCCLRELIGHSIFVKKA
ncbi:serine/threonine protein kinase, partial [Reticulomyxa filosa]